MQCDLNEIGIKYGTDKASSGHNYLAFYERFFSKFRHKNIKLLEIGVFGGASLNVWREYFPSAEIIGVDINPSCRRYRQDRVGIEILDQSNVEELAALAHAHGPFDIIIEDGSHFWEHQITSLRHLFPFVKNGGFYVVEDLHTSYGQIKDQFKGISSISCAEYLKKWVDLCCGDEQVDIAQVEDAFLRTYGRSVSHISFARHCCIIEKYYCHTERMIDTGAPLFGVSNGKNLSLIAHVAGIGDVISQQGYVNLPGETHQIQGISIECEYKLLYRVLDQSNNWSEWCGNGVFAGSRGQAISLRGLEVKPVGKGGTPVLDIACRFAAVKDTIRCHDGESCISPSGEPLCGIQLSFYQGM